VTRGTYKGRFCTVLREQIRNDECRWVEIQVWNASWSAMVIEWVLKSDVLVEEDRAVHP